ncbi:MAG: manganese efflux pump [Bacilli bacterium]|nr:manganese efflux pump [Bacilli bacterium]
MKLIEIIFIGIGLAMDAFAVSICKGLSMNRLDYRKAIIISLYFSIFQIIMPLFGFLIGNNISNLFKEFDHWIIFFLLTFIGSNMLKEENESQNDSIKFSIMIILALATSIDAFAVGITFSFFILNIPFVLLTIGIITFILSFIGVIFGNQFGNKYQQKAKKLGGIILILIGLKILLEHLLN